MMQRRHFEVVASSLGRVLKNFNLKPKRAEQIAENYSMFIAKENPKFNHEKFVKAVMESYAD